LVSSVHNETEQTAIVEALRTTFGAANIDGHLLIDRNVKRATWLPRVGDLFAALKTSGADISLTGDSLRLGGWLSAVDREALTGRLHSILGTRLGIASLSDAAVDAVRTANDKALSALGAMTTAVTPEAVVQAMDLSVINFATGSDQIPADSAEVIRKSAEAIKRSPPGSKIEVGGHTDNTGDSASNIALSQARADAVKQALVAAGVSVDVLAARGYGDTRPRASNDTEFGRFRNRRIEYAVVTTR
jgi:OmpA-OmpF porin, OOP family